MKFIITFAVLTFALISAQAQQQKPAAATTAAQAVQTKQIDAPADWEFFDFVIFPGVPSSADSSRVYGLKLSPTISAGYGIVGGVEMAAFSCMTENIDGTQLAPLFNSAKDMDGLQASLVNVTEKMCGLQLGLVNVSKKTGFQIGVVNYIKDGPVPFLPIINFAF